MKEYDCIYYNQSPGFMRPPLHDISRTLKTDIHPPAVIVPQKEKDMEEFKTIVGSKQANAKAESVYGIAPTITAACGMGGDMTPMLTDATIDETKTDTFMEQMRKTDIQLPPELEGKKFRIRKLTPRECFRLMDVDDADIDKIQAAGLSNSAQYKLAGNSIVVNVLYHIFRKMFIDTEPDRMPGEQLRFF